VDRRPIGSDGGAENSTARRGRDSSD